MDAVRALIPTQPGRPPVVQRDGVTVFVSVHDAWFLAEWQRLRAAMRAAHPDAGGTVTRFTEARLARDTFYRREQEWYAALGLVPPVGLHLPEVATPLTPLQARVLRAICHHEARHAHGVAHQLHLTRARAANTCNVLLRRGYLEATDVRPVLVDERTRVERPTTRAQRRVSSSRGAPRRGRPRQIVFTPTPLGARVLTGAVDHA